MLLLNVPLAEYAVVLEKRRNAKSAPQPHGDCRCAQQKCYVWAMRLCYASHDLASLSHVLFHIVAIPVWMMLGRRMRNIFTHSACRRTKHDNHDQMGRRINRPEKSSQAS